MDKESITNDVWAKLPDIWKNSGYITFDDVKEIVDSSEIDWSPKYLMRLTPLEIESTFEGVVKYLEKYKSKGAVFILGEEGCLVEHIDRETEEETRMRIVKCLYYSVCRLVNSKI